MHQIVVRFVSDLIVPVLDSSLLSETPRLDLCWNPDRVFGDDSLTLMMKLAADLSGPNAFSERLLSIKRAYFSRQDWRGWFGLNRFRV